MKQILKNQILNIIAPLNIPDECGQDHDFVTMMAEFVDTFANKLIEEGKTKTSFDSVTNGVRSLITAWKVRKDLSVGSESELKPVTAAADRSLEDVLNEESRDRFPSVPFSELDTVETDLITLAVSEKAAVAFRQQANALTAWLPDTREKDFTMGWVRHTTSVPLDCAIRELYSWTDQCGKWHLSLKVKGQREKVAAWLENLPTKEAEDEPYYRADWDPPWDSTGDPKPGPKPEPVPMEISEELPKPEPKPEKDPFAPPPRMDIYIDQMYLELLDQSGKSLPSDLAPIMDLMAVDPSMLSTGEFAMRSWIQRNLGLPPFISIGDISFWSRAGGRCYLSFSVRGPAQRVEDWLRGLSYSGLGLYRVTSMRALDVIRSEEE
jgi:hypothetical protein